MGVSDQETARLQEQVKTLFNDISELKCDVGKIKEDLANRLPVWATLALSMLTALCGFLGAKAF